MATSIAVLGTGIMGAPMARNMASAGLDVRAWNRTRDKAEPLAEDGVQVHDEAAEAVQGADLVMTIVSDGDAVRSVITDEGALEAMRGDAVWIQASTVGLEATRELSELAAGRGIVFVDSPMLGTRQPAEDAKLIVLASGPESAREPSTPAFEAIATKTFWLGEAGAGSRMKLVINAWLLALVEGLAESVVLAEGLGVDPSTFIDIIDGGPMGPPYAKLKGKMMIEGDFPTAFALEMAAKDARLVGDAAREAGVDLPLPAIVAEHMQRVAEAGHGDEDMAAVVRAWRKR